MLINLTLIIFNGQSSFRMKLCCLHSELAVYNCLKTYSTDPVPNAHTFMYVIEPIDLFKAKSSIYSLIFSYFLIIR